MILPTGRASDGLGTGTTGLDLNLPVSKQFGDFYVHANLGYTWLPDLQRVTHVAGSGIWRVAPMFNLLFEGVVNVDEDTNAPHLLNRAVEELRQVPAIREAWVVRIP